MQILPENDEDKEARVELHYKDKAYEQAWLVDELCQVEFNIGRTVYVYKHLGCYKAYEYVTVPDGIETTIYTSLALTRL